MKNCTTLYFNSLRYTVWNEELAKISKENLEHIQKFDLQNKRKGLTDRTRENNISHIIMLAKHFKKDFKDLTANELLMFMDSLDISNSSKEQYVILAKKFFKWLYKTDYPEVTSKLVRPKVRKKRKSHSELLTEEEMNTLINAYETPQQKALVSVLYDSACRVGELIKLKRKDITCDNGLWNVSVPDETKTGVRDIPLTLSVVYLERWFNTYHPSKNPDAPLFFSTSPKDRNKPLKGISQQAVWYLLQSGAEKSDIEKHVHPHLLRHSRLTYLSDGMSESMLRIFAGWSDESTMPATYIHNNPKNLRKKIVNQQSGKPPEEIREKSKLEPKVCPRCNELNDVNAEYCSKCWIPLKVEIATKELMIVQFLRSEMYQSDKSQLQEFDLEFLANKYNGFLKESHRENRKQVKTLPH
jgi:integrase/ribosomal protein L40E